MNPGTVSVAGHSLGAANGALTVVGFFCGLLAWISGFPAMLVAVGERVDAFARWVAYASAVVLALFGASFVWTAVSTFA